MRPGGGNERAELSDELSDDLSSSECSSADWSDHLNRLPIPLQPGTSSSSRLHRQILAESPVRAVTSSEPSSGRSEGIDQGRRFLLPSEITYDYLMSKGDFGVPCYHNSPADDGPGMRRDEARVMLDIGHRANRTRSGQLNSETNERPQRTATLFFFPFYDKLKVRGEPHTIADLKRKVQSGEFEFPAPYH